MKNQFFNVENEAKAAFKKTNSEIIKDGLFIVVFFTYVVTVLFILVKTAW
jgi:hypothetical protein